MMKGEVILGKKKCMEYHIPEALEGSPIFFGSTISYKIHNQFLLHEREEIKFEEFCLSHFSTCCPQQTKVNVSIKAETKLTLSYAKSGKVMITRGNESLLWDQGSMNMEVLPCESDRIATYNKCENVERGHIVLNKTYVEKLANIYPDILTDTCRALELDKRTVLGKENIPINRRINSILANIEKCQDMGNYAKKYAESKILDCLSITINHMSGSNRDLWPINFVMKSKMMDARNILQQNYQSPPTLHELAMIIGTNECTLKYMFRQIFNTTVFQYLFDHRMKLGAHYLLETQLPVNQIGTLLGYDYPSHFCSAFRRKFGMPPSEFRLRRPSLDFILK